MFDAQTLITTFGYIGLTFIVFAESGLFFGFFLPGDSLLFTAGFLASQNSVSLPHTIILVLIAAIAGDSVGYYFGKKTGPKIFVREESLLFDPNYITETENFFKKYGPLSLVLARFTPIIRTFTPIFAGVGNMKYKTFITYNILGAMLWVLSMTLSGYYLGQLFPQSEQYIDEIIIGIILISLSPSLYHLIHNKSFRKKLIQKIARSFSK